MFILKFKKCFFILSIFILILIIGSVNAADNASVLNESVQDENSLEISTDDIDVVKESNEVSNNGFNATTRDEYFIDFVFVEVEMPEDAKNNLTISVDGTNIKNVSSRDVIEKDGVFNLNLSSFSIGSHNLMFNYTGDDYTFFKETSFELTLFMASIPTSVMVNDDSDEYGPAIRGLGVDGLKGNITIYIDGKKKITFSYWEDDLEGYSLCNLEFGNHTIEVRFTNGTYSYSKKVNVTVWYGFPVDYHLRYGKSDSYISISIPYDLGNGKITVKIDGKSYKYTKKDYNLLIQNPNLSMGSHEISVSYSGDKKYYPTVFTREIGVMGEIDLPENEFYVTGGDKISLNLPKNAKGNLCLNVSVDDGNDFVYYNLFKIPLVDGKAAFSFNQLPLNKIFFFICYYDGDDYDVDWSVKHYQVFKPKLAGAKDITMYYSDGTSFKVQVKDSLGNSVVSVYVAIKINGKLVKKVLTDENGWAIYKIPNVPKKYTITAEIGNVKVTKKLTVKQILSLKKVKVKKNAKKLVLTASLKKIKGKYLKGKKIIFKFNGKTYKAKTNKKGIAKLTIKRSVLKKLKVGKKVKYQATYIKDTVKRTAKVKR